MRVLANEQIRMVRCLIVSKLRRNSRVLKIISDLENEEDTECLIDLNRGPSVLLLLGERRCSIAMKCFCMNEIRRYTDG